MTADVVEVIEDFYGCESDLTTLLKANNLEIVQGWQPIDEKAKDGEDWTLGNIEGTQIIGSWDKDVSRWDTLDGPSYHEHAFTHYCPLRTPPTE